MAFLRRLFGGKNKQPGEVSMNRMFYVDVAGEKIPSIYVDEHEKPEKVLKLLKLNSKNRPSIFITGGAGNMTEEDKRMTREIFEKAIAPFAQEHQIVVIDGATKSGVIEMMATARRKGNFTFPLIGMAPHKNISYPGKDTGGNELCAGHSHFVFVSGEEYGAESNILINTAHILAGGIPNSNIRQLESVGIVVNGGKITQQEVQMATSKELDIPLIVLEGSGRFADELAAAARTGETSQNLIRAIITRGNIQLASTAAGPTGMLDKLKIAFSTKL